MSVVKAFIVPGIPHPLLCPEKNAGWQQLREGFETLGQEIVDSGADLILLYSTMWPSVIGHQIQARPEPEWVHVDELFHDLGSIPYKFKIDVDFAKAYEKKANDRGLHARTVDYHGFPIDTGSVTALKLLTPNNEVPACIVSSNVYADRAETMVLGKAALDAALESGKKIAAGVVMTLSNRLFTDIIAPEDDHIHSLKDEEWNQKLLQFIREGRIEDLAQLSREIHRQIRVKKVVNFKPFWWLSAVTGQSNAFDGKVHAYAPLYGTGGAVCSFTPTPDGIGNKEFDEGDVDFFGGDRNVLEQGGVEAVAEDPPAVAQESTTAGLTTDKAAAPVGAYPHARRVGDVLYLSGVGPRQPGTNAIPGGPIRDENGKDLDYDVAAQTRAVVENIRQILEAAGSSLDKVVDVTAFLVDMDRDFATYNKTYTELLGHIGPTRTTVEIRALPTPIAVEFKVVALP
jgi:enamine deaminase RidA (YjgF/YER057c/UK114 family)/aromatic ring-opening dioxygenase catalytic subunit (LigB family)